MSEVRSWTDPGPPPVEVVAALDYRDALEKIERLRAALKGSVEVIKTWHNMSRIGFRGDPTLEAVWDIYWRNAPEMKPIREALGAHETTRDD